MRSRPVRVRPKLFHVMVTDAERAFLDDMVKLEGGTQRDVLLRAFGLLAKAHGVAVPAAVGNVPDGRRGRKIPVRSSRKADRRSMIAARARGAA